MKAKRVQFFANNYTYLLSIMVDSSDPAVMKLIEI